MTEEFFYPETAKVEEVSLKRKIKHQPDSRLNNISYQFSRQRN